MRQRGALEQHRVGRVGAGAAGARDQIVEEVEGRRISADVVHRISAYLQMGLPDPGSP